MSAKNYEQLLERELAGARAEIDRLVRWGDNAVVARDAAVAEIERLRKSLDDKPDAIDLNGQIVQLKAELAKHQGSEFHPDWSLLQATRESLREAGAEVERLKKDNADLQRQRDGVQYAKDFLELTIQRKDQEIEKLKAENDDIASGNGWLIECQKKVAEKLRAEIAELKSTRPQSAAEVLAAVRSEAAPYGWSDQTKSGHPIEFALAVGKRIVGIVVWCGSETATMWTSGGVDVDCDTSHPESWGFNLVPLPAPTECTAEPVPPSTPTRPPTADTGIPSAAEVLGAARSVAVPRGWSDITAGGHRVVAAFFDYDWGRIAAVIDLGEDRVGGRYVENAWNAETGKGYRGAGCDLVPATELEVWGVGDQLPPPVPDPDCQPDVTDEPPPCMVPVDHAEIEIRTVDRMFAVPSEIVRRGNYEVITCDHLRIVRPRQ